MEKVTDNWIAIVYDQGDKISSRLFEGHESDVRTSAGKWAKDKFNSVDWSLHKINDAEK